MWLVCQGFLLAPFSFFLFRVGGYFVVLVLESHPLLVARQVTPIVLGRVEGPVGKGWWVGLKGRGVCGMTGIYCCCCWDVFDFVYFALLGYASLVMPPYFSFPLF
ncbi:unnamed protein product, partial [Discosporangium mesarthrocarpum]